MHRGLTCLGLTFKARWLQGLFLNPIFGAQNLMTAHTLADKLPSCEGSTHDNHESNAQDGISKELCMRLLLFLEAGRQSVKPNRTRVIIIIIVRVSLATVALATVALATVALALALFHLISVSALLVVLRLVPVAHKPVLTAWIFFEVLSSTLFVLLVAGERQVWARVRHFGAVPTFGAFFAALTIAIHL